jgi:SAM-dependent methyltransferase
MDYRDLEAGAKRDFFWFKAKLKLIDVVLAKLRSEKELKILSVGCGTGEEIKVLRDYGKVYAIDIEAKALALVPDELCEEKRLADVCRIPYTDDFFDLAVSFDILEHVKDDVRAVREISRVLKDDGFFVFTVPAFRFLFSSHDRALQHFRRYNKKILRERLRAFRRIEMGFWMSFLFLPVAVMRLIRRNKSVDRIHYRALPPLVNNLLYRLLQLENWLIEHRIPLPVGTTIYGIFQNQKEREGENP